MSEEDGSINENADLSSGEEDVTPREPEAVSEPEGEIVSPIIEEGGIDEAATEEAISGQGEPIEASKVKQPQFALQTKSKKQTTKTIMKIQRSLVDTKKQIEKQRTQITNISQNLETLQKQMRAGERKTEIVNQIRSQVNQIQKHVSQIQKSIQKRSTSKLQSNKKVVINKSKNKKNKK
jgi:predicted RNase H-like nuclease (RuvC/YqgF family)